MSRDGRQQGVCDGGKGTAQTICRAQLDEWKADVAKLKARAAGAKADVQTEMDKHMKGLDHTLHKAGARLSELAAAGEDTWDSARKNFVPRLVL